MVRSETEVRVNDHYYCISGKLCNSLWSFGLRSLRFRECGLDEAADLVFGDHLTERSCTVKYVDVSLPSKRSHRLKSHKELERLAVNDPDSDEIFERCLIEDYYPDRPDLEQMCLYEFVK